MKLPQLSFTVQIFAGLISGILVGLFFGEPAAILEPFANIFIGLMQITIIPSVIIFIITGIGTIGHEDAKKFLRTVAAILLLIWFLGVLIFFFMQFAFPVIQKASLFSTTEVPGADDTSLIDLFIPSNPFFSLSEGLMPAIVLFCLLLGFALIGDERNRPFVDMIQGLSTTLSKITRLMMKIVPLGIFAITASTFATLTFTQFLQIQVYLITTIVIAVILVILILPLLIYSLTPFSFRQIISAAKDGVLMGFSTSHVFITIPLLTDGVASLFREPRTEEKAKAYSGILIPLTYTIPSLGVFIVLLFVLFTAWFYGNPFGIQEQAYLALVGVPSLFGSPKLSLQFILEQMRLPADALQLYLISNPFHVYFASALTCMSMFALSAICTAFLTGVGNLRMKRALMAIVITVIVLSATVVGLNAGFTSLLGNSSQADETILNLKMPVDATGKRVDQALETKVYKTYSEVPLVPDTSRALENASLLKEIKSRDVLRVGYNPDTMPLAYFNKEGELVGYDIHMAYDLARTLNVSRIEFIPLDQGTLFDRVNNGSCDIVMAGVVLVPGIMEEARFTSPYLDLHLAFVTRDDRKNDFEQLEDVAQMKGLKIAIATDSEYYQTVSTLFPEATLIPIDHPEQFFNQTEADVLLTTAEVGTAMTLLHPFYDVAILQPSDTYKTTCVYVVSRNCDDASLMFINYWLDMEEKYGSLDKKYQYWVLGKDTGNTTQRWSIIRDVLHWIE